MDPNSQNSATVPYIGSKISLISNVDIRYEGILYSINTFESTVALQNVRSFGTEGRRTPEIMPSNKTYQFIIFKGKDIKDLTVCEPVSTRIPDDPAVVSVNVPPSTPSSSMMPGGHQSQIQSPPMGQRGMMSQGGDVGQSGYGGGNQMYRMGGGRNVQSGGGQMPQGGRMPGYPHGGPMPVIRAPQGAFGFGGHRGGGGVDMYPRQRGSFGGVMGEMDGGGMGPRGGRYNPRGRGGGRGGGSRRVVGELLPQPNQAVKKELSKAFDFESSNAKFDKSEVKTEGAAKNENGENTAATETKRTGYDKTTSFFDRISCETLDRASGQETRVDREKQRQLDCETFGAAAAAPRGRSYRRGYLRGGGGARRGRGGAYGGYSRGTGRYVQVSYMQGGGGAGYGMPRF